MSPFPRVATAFRYSLVGIALLLTAYNGVIEGINAMRVADTTGMKVATATQLLYGIAALVVLAMALFRRELVFPILVVWGLGVVFTAGLAPVVYAGRSVPVGLAVAAGVAVVVALVLWAWPGPARVTTGSTNASLRS